MNFPLMALGALVGWCGTRGPRPPLPKDPIIGAIAGAVAVLALSAGLGFAAMPSASELIVLSIGAFAAGRAVSDAVNMIIAARKGN